MMMRLLGRGQGATLVSKGLGLGGLLIPWGDTKVKVQDLYVWKRFGHVHFGLFSKKGFPSAMRAEAKERDIRLIE